MSSPKYEDKDRGVAIFLSLFFGIFGLHRFYLGDLLKGVLYLVFFWTGIPLLLGFYDAYKYITNREQFGLSSKPTSRATNKGNVGGSSESTTKRENVGGSSESTTKRENVGSSSEPTTKTTRNENVETDSSKTVETPEGAVMTVSGINGKVILYDDRLEISRAGIGMLHKMQHGLKGDKEISYESITSVQLRKPSSVTRGYIQFGQSGYSESDDGLFDAVSDENTVLFDKNSLSEFQALRAKLRELKKGDIEESTGTMDGAMEKLRERYAMGEIDEEEYEQRKEILQKD